MSASEVRIALPKRILKPGRETSNTRTLGRINQKCNLPMVKTVKKYLGEEFKKIEDSFLAPIVEMALCQKIKFSRHLAHHLLQRRILTDDDNTDELWFAFGEQPMRFSLREFVLATGLPPNGEVIKSSSTTKLGKRKRSGKTKGKRKKKGKNKKSQEEEAEEEEGEEEEDEGLDPWMKKEQTLQELLDFLIMDDELKKSKEKKKSKQKRLSADSRVRLGATIIVESTLLARYRTRKIKPENLKRAKEFDKFCGLFWAKEGYRVLVKSIKSLKPQILLKEQYSLFGFVYALQVWALSSVPQLGLLGGTRVSDIQDPLYRQWAETYAMDQSSIKKVEDNPEVYVTCIIGDPNMHRNLVEDPKDIEFQKVVNLVMNGYRLKKRDWNRRYVDEVVASNEIELVNALSPIEIEGTDSEKVKILMEINTQLRKRVCTLKQMLGMNENINRGLGVDNADDKQDDDEEQQGDVVQEWSEEEEDDEHTEEGATIDSENSVDSEETLGNFVKKLRRSYQSEKVNEGGQECENEMETNEIEKQNDFGKEVEEEGETEKVDEKETDDDIFIPNSKRIERETKHPEETGMSSSKMKNEDPFGDPFEQYDPSKETKLINWKKSSQAKMFKVAGGNEVNAQWFTELETPGKIFTKEHMNATMTLLRIRRKRYPNLFSDNRVAIYGEEFGQILFDCYRRWTGDAEYKFNNGIRSYVNGTVRLFGNPRKKWVEDIDYIYAPRLLYGFVWFALMIDLKNRTVSLWNSGNNWSSDITYTNVAHPFATIIPLVLKTFIKGENDESAFTIELPPEFPTVTEKENCPESGLYTFKIIECHSIKWGDMSKLCDENVGRLRKKLACDIFAELNVEPKKLTGNEKPNVSRKSTRKQKSKE